MKYKINLLYKGMEIEMKIAINTIMDGANYGNRLQNYALQTVLENMGCDVETLQKTTRRDIKGIKKIRHIGVEIIKKVLGKNGDWNKRKRYSRFRKFNHKYIKLSKYTIGYGQAPLELNQIYDFFVSGSDQIWNTKFDIIEDDIDNYLCKFASANKRISYAASFGTNELEEKYISLFKSELSKFQRISVREEAGKQIVEKLCGCEATVVLDPTMLISTRQWLEVASKPSYLEEEDFIVTYFMSGRNLEIEKYIEKVKKHYNAKNVINLEIEFLGDNEIENKPMYQSDPAEFVWLIANAKCVLTDSFHSTVFSILFHKPFCVFERQAVEMGNDMGSRIDTLLTRFGLEQYKDNIDKPKIVPDEYEVERIEQKLAEERKTSLMFLKGALGVSDCTNKE